ncbi:MAG: molybdate ABC transporter substrate-binding protein [Planctomycetes bacterium]|nr:molybdate ABC transporter substrate-binding protein [Planctomycetota bacterium]
MSMRNLLIGSLLLAVSMVVLLRMTTAPEVEDKPRNALILYCAANMKNPVEEAARQYEQEYGVAVQLTYGGSGTLLSNLQVAGLGDLYLAADASYIALAREKNLVAEVLPLAKQHPVIAVAKGNPKKIASLDDLLRSDVRVALANPDAASIGKIAKRVLRETNQWEPLEKAVQTRGVFKPTVMEVANDVKLGSVDAAIVYDSTARQFPDLEAVELPLFKPRVEDVSLSILRFSKAPTAALRFARYLQAPEKGGAIFKKWGFESVDGDAWAERPELTLFSGAMLRPAIDDLIHAFEQREGVTITTVYNGCGILTSQMRAGAKTDAYFSCDLSYFESVKEKFDSGVIVSANDMVILVAKENPKNIRTIEDLVKPGMRVGLAHPVKSALGGLTQKLLDAQGLYQKLIDTGNWKVESATGDYLVNQMRVGSLDAVLVYTSNAAFVREHLDVIKIDVPSAHAVQPYGVAKDSKHRYLMERLLEAIRSDASKKRFEELGFQWRADALKEAPQP